MTLKQQNELTLKRIELQMIEDYFSKEARDNRKQHGQKSSGQMLAMLRKYDLTKWLRVVWDDSMTKEFKEALSTLYSATAPYDFGIKESHIFSKLRGKEGYYSWKIKDTDHTW